MNQNVVNVNGKELVEKEYNAVRVVTLRDIDELHGRPEGTARKRFNDNKKRFVEGRDYFVLTNRDDMRAFGITRVQGGTPNRLILLTESGYALIMKSFRNDFAWETQSQMHVSYFLSE